VAGMGCAIPMGELASAQQVALPMGCPVEVSFVTPHLEGRLGHATVERSADNAAAPPARRAERRERTVGRSTAAAVGKYCDRKLCNQ
jgi:hypothetical protein